MDRITYIKRLSIALILTWLTGLNPAYAVSISGYYLDETKGNPRITFTLSGETRYKLFTLDDPDRLILDIPKGKWMVQGQQKGKKPSSLQGLRYGKYKGDRLRVVLDFNRKVRIKDHYQLPSGRLGIVFEPYGDITPTIKHTKKQSAPPPDQPSEQHNNKSLLSSFANAKIPGYTRSIFSKSSNDKTSHTQAAKPERRTKPLIVIDPGHGGKDPGAISKSGMYEKIITLRYAKALKKLLEQSGKYRVYMTRESDVYIPLKSRVKKSRNVNGDVFISLHADSHANPSTKGLSVYTISEKRAEREARKLLQKSGKEEVITGVDLTEESHDVRSVIIDMVQQDTKNTSAFFAELLVQELGKKARLLRNTHRFGSLAVLTGADIPSVLIELGYLSNRKEDKLLQQSHYQKTLVHSIKRAIDKFFAASS